MKQYLVSYTLLSQNKSISGKDSEPTSSLDSAFEIFDMLNAGDDLYVTITPPGDRLIISAEEEGVYIELDFVTGGYLGKTMTRSEAREVLKNSELYLKNPEAYGFEDLPHS